VHQKNGIPTTTNGAVPPHADRDDRLRRHAPRIADQMQKHRDELEQRGEKMHAHMMQRENGGAEMHTLGGLSLKGQALGEFARASEVTLDADGSGFAGTKAHARFSLEFDVRWADCDPNRHLRHSAYADYATHVRFAYIEAQGFALPRFEEERFGPVIFREETQYLREVRLGERIKLDFEVLAFSEDHIRWSVMHTVWNGAGKRAAIVSLDGCWLDMDTRKAIVPPDDLRDIMRRLPVGKVPSYKRFLR
jgi:acyl-CoA thioester hydrolase